jgi:MFS superfamily sulfate permease-like transporter
MGLYSAIIAAIVGALWGSSNHLHSGPTNTASILVLATLLPIAARPARASLYRRRRLLAVMVGVFRLVMGLARLGLLVTFVSDSVIIGFTAGARLLIAVSELRSLLRVETTARRPDLDSANLFTLDRNPLAPPGAGIRHAGGHAAVATILPQMAGPVDSALLLR